MRIWILNHYASPPDRPAGTRHYEFGRVLAAQGHDVTIFASSFSHFSRREERLIPGERMKVESVDGVRFVWIRTIPYARNDHRRVLNVMSYALGVVLAQPRLPRPDVVVGSSVHLPAVAAAWLISALRRAQFVSRCETSGPGRSSILARCGSAAPPPGCSRPWSISFTAGRTW